MMTYQYDITKHVLLLWKVCYHWMNVLYIMCLSQKCILLYMYVIFGNIDIESNWIKLTDFLEDLHVSGGRLHKGVD